MSGNPGSPEAAAAKSEAMPTPRAAEYRRKAREDESEGTGREAVED
jgi:hypothetical protein